MDGLKTAHEIAKQVITLSTGVVALTITFLEKIAQPSVSAARVVPDGLKIAWICFGVTIALAIWTLMAIAGSMNALDRQERGLPLDEAQRLATTKLADGLNVRIPALAMLALFLTAMGFTIGSGFAI